jgi:hypothetical protein
MKVTPQYPVFVIFQEVGTGHLPVVAGTGSNDDCFLAYQNKELAELYIEQVKDLAARHGDKYHPVEMSETQFKLLLRANADVRLVSWNSTNSPSTFVFLSREEILAG